MFSHLISSWHKLASTLSHYWFCQSLSTGNLFHRLLSSGPSFCAFTAMPFSPLFGLSSLSRRSFSLVSFQQLISDDWKGGWLLSVDFLSWDWLRMCVRSDRFLVETFKDKDPVVFKSILWFLPFLLVLSLLLPHAQSSFHQIFSCKIGAHWGQGLSNFYVQEPRYCLINYWRFHMTFVYVGNTYWY